MVKDLKFKIGKVFIFWKSKWFHIKQLVKDLDS